MSERSCCITFHLINFRCCEAHKGDQEEGVKVSRGEVVVFLEFNGKHR